MKLQNVPQDYLPDADLLPRFVHALPELHYPMRLNAAVELLERTLAFGHGERPAYYFEGRVITYRELARDVDRFGNALHALGIQPGDRVLLRLRDQPELIVAILALLKVGAIAVPTYPMLRAQHLAYREQDTESVAAIVSADLLEEIEKARPTFEHIKHIVVIPDAQAAGHLGYQKLLQEAAPELDPAPTRRDDYALILYTSGSTGDPKGVLWSHGDVVAQADSYCRACVQPSPDDVFIGPPPVPFAAGLLFFLIAPLRFGASGVLMKEKTPDKMLDAVIRYRGTIFIAMATYYNTLLKSERSHVRQSLGTVRQTLVGGEPVAQELSAQWLEASGHRLVQFLGTTEMSNVFLSYRWGADPILPASVGRPVPGYQVAVRDSVTFDELERGQPGLLTVIGPTGTKYWRKPDEQRRAVREGWNICQDLVTMDQEGFVYHLGRTDDIIVSAGFNISPVEVEAVLLKHPAVAEVACIGVPDPSGVRSSIVKAYVVLRTGVTLRATLAREIQDFFKERGAPYMYPREIVFVDELPKTVTGKMSRSALRRLETSVG